MRKLITIILVLFTLSLSAQKRSYDKCVTVTVEKIENYKVKVTTYNKCKEVIIIRTYLESEWKKIVAKRKNRKKHRRNG